MATDTKDKLSKVALTGLLALTAVGLSSCGGQEKPISCLGAVKGSPNSSVLMSAGQCKKVAGGRVTQAADAQVASYKPDPYSSYIKCYGIAAAGKNDCGTKATACAGSVHIAGQSDAWISYPESLCNKLGGRVVDPKQAKINKAKTASSDTSDDKSQKASTPKNDKKSEKASSPKSNGKIKKGIIHKSDNISEK